MSRRKVVNPFYVVLIIVGVVFAVTACAYGVMTVRMLNPDLVGETSTQGAGLMRFLDQHGFALMMIQLTLLALASFAAMATDRVFDRKAQQEENDKRRALHEDPTLRKSGGGTGQHGGS